MNWDFVIASATVVLVFVTAVYVWLTHKLVQQSVRANDLSRETALKHYLSESCPIVFPSILRESGKPVIELSNAGKNPAYDIDVHVISLLHVEDIELDEFIQRDVREESKESCKIIANHLLDGEIFGVQSRFAYYIFPPMRKVIAELPDIQLCDMFCVLVQWRDTNGINYGRVFDFGAPINKQQRYPLFSIEPMATIASDRVTGIGNKYPLELTCTEDDLPEYINVEFKNAYTASIPVGLTRYGDFWIEDKGRWENL
ncbi:MAG TPA: hypothetical protein PL103_07965 [Saccharofermentans sp.]|nr:hypothetical protein [Saccharofermentans sp.]